MYGLKATYGQGFKLLINTIASPHEILSQKLIAPYTKAPLSILVPIRSAVIERLVTSMAEDPPPMDLDNTLYL